MATASSFSALPGSGSLLHDGDDEGQEAGAGAGDIIVTPGEVITDATGFLRGHGSYLSRGTLVASVAGSVQRVNKLVSVQPVSSRYSGHVGDVVVGRVVEVGAKVWKVDINARQHGTLMLASLALAGGVQRRRTQEDQLAMRSMLAEGDLVSSDVHSFHQDGGIVLHARSVKYGKLSNGCLVKVRPSLVPRQAHHFVSLPCGVDAVLGNNGFIWLTGTLATSAQAGSSSGAVDITVHEQAEVGVVEAVEARKAVAASRIIPADARRSIARVRNSILALAAGLHQIRPANIMAVYSASEKAGLAAKELLNPDTAGDLVTSVAHALQQ